MENKNVNNKESNATQEKTKKTEAGEEKKTQDTGVQNQGKKKNTNWRRRGKARVASKVHAKGGLEPMYLTRVQGELKDDLGLEVDPLDFPWRSLGAIPYSRHFTADYSSFISIAEREWFELAERDVMFKKTVTMEWWIYYCVQHFWMRIVMIKAHHGDGNQTAAEYRERIANKQYPIPDVISSYLRSIGDVVDLENIIVTQNLPEYPRKDGSVGRVSADTHYIYSEIPQPRITVEAIQASYKYSTDQGDELWNLPGPLRPIEVHVVQDEEVNLENEEPINNNDAQDEADIDGGEDMDSEDEDDALLSLMAETTLENLPTKNLLGWRPATKMRPKQLQQSAEIGIIKGRPTIDLHTFLFSEKLMDYVAIKLRNTKAKLDLGPHRSRFGSITNVPQVEVTTPPPTLERYTSGTVQLRTAYDLGGKLLVASGAYSFRVIRNNHYVGRREVRPWSCYSFNAYRDVPDTWDATKNARNAVRQVMTWDAFTLACGPLPKDNLLYQATQSSAERMTKQ